MKRLVSVWSSASCLLYWTAMPAARSLMAAQRDGRAWVDWPLDRLVTAVAGCAGLVVAALLLASAVLVVTVRGVSELVPVLAGLERLTGPRWWRQSVLAACGLGLALPAAAAPAVGQADLERRPHPAHSADPLAGLPLPDLPNAPAAAFVGARLRPPPSAWITVRPGDSLWRIAARRLDGRASDAGVARSVARLYALNRSTVGADPDLILPGTRLIAPRRLR